MGLFYILLVPVALVGFLWLKYGSEKPVKKMELKKRSKDELSSYSKGKHSVVAPDAEASIKVAKSGFASMSPRIVMDVFKQAVERHGSSEALKVERPIGNWVTWSWNEYYADTMTAARAMLTLGLERFGTVNIIGFNSPEWLIGNMAAIAAGAKAAGIYTTNGPEACEYISKHSEASIVIVENEMQLNKFLQIRDNLPKLKAIVIYDGQVPAGAKSSGKAEVFSWKDFMALGNGSDKDSLQSEIDTRISKTKPGHACTLIYTSGTTGNPKAVMISNDNCVFTASAGLEELEPTEAGEHMLSYLPLSHIAAQMLDIHFPLISTAVAGINTTVWFARPDALKGSLTISLAACRPTRFFGVPRVWEKIQEAMVAVGKNSKGAKLALTKWAKGKGLEGALAGEVDGSGKLPAWYDLADKIVFSKVKAKLGLDRCKQMLTGAAPISRDTLNFFSSLGIHVLELYGMSECTGPQTMCLPNYRKTGSCGKDMVGVETLIQHEAGRDKPGEGEICFRGRHIMMGYMNDAKKTAEAIDEDGWLHSGDVGRVDEFGLLYITGRIKELLITAGGENIAPVPVEDALKSACPAVSNCMMVGDKRKYNCILVTLKTEPNADGSFSDKLAGAAKDVNPDVTTVGQAIKDPTWQEYIKKGIATTNSQAVSNASKVQKFEILPTDFSIPGGELGPTLKLKRPVVTEKYASVIEGFYN